MNRALSFDRHSQSPAFNPRLASTTMNKQTLIRTSCALAITASVALAESKPGEWPAFRGPTGNGLATAPKSVRDWKHVQLHKTWKLDTNAGFSSFSVGAGKAFTIVTDEVDGNKGEVLEAIDVKSGKKAWSKPLTPMGKYDGGGDSGTNDNKGGDGARSTPTVDGTTVYAIDSNLGVYCFDAATGKEVEGHAKTWRMSNNRRVLPYACQS